MALSKSGAFFRKNRASAKKKQKATAKLNKKPSAVKKRVEANRARRKAKAAGKNIKGKHYDHAVGKFVSAKTNMGRKGEGGRKKGVKKKK
jgi:hypothetical protein